MEVFWCFEKYICQDIQSDLYLSLSQNHEVENDHDLAIFGSVTGAVIWKIIKLDTRQGNINK